MNLLELLSDFADDDNEDLQIQCDVFFEFKQEDDDVTEGGLNLDSHVDLFNAIFNKVSLRFWAKRDIIVLFTLLTGAA